MRTLLTLCALAVLLGCGKEIEIEPASGRITAPTGLNLPMVVLHERHTAQGVAMGTVGPIRERTLVIPAEIVELNILDLQSWLDQPFDPEVIQPPPVTYQVESLMLPVQAETHFAPMRRVSSPELSVDGQLILN